MSYAEEFGIVDLILKSRRKTRGVDAFALSLIKAERQMRRLVTHLVYQSSSFAPANKEDLRRTLARNTDVYFKGVVRGFDALSPVSARFLAGDDYDQLWGRLKEAGKYRNKIFHGQVTGDGLDRKQLEAHVKDIRLWCKTIADRAMNEFQYDGFSNSLRKSNIPDLTSRLKIQITSIDEYATFIEKHMQRKRARGKSE